MVGKFNGKLVGYREYASKDKTDEKTGEVKEQGKMRHVYAVFCTGVRPDKETGLFSDDCKVVNIIEDEQVLPKLKYGLEVEFYGETVEFRDKSGNTQSRIQYSDISVVGGAK